MKDVVDQAVERVSRMCNSAVTFEVEEREARVRILAWARIQQGRSIGSMVTISPQPIEYMIQEYDINHAVDHVVGRVWRLLGELEVGVFAKVGPSALSKESNDD